MTQLETEIYNRTALLVGDEGMARLQAVRVIIFGVGGVCSWCAEGLLRSGITHLTLVDADNVCISNVNRQLMATPATVGRGKVEVMRERLLEINPDACVETVQMLYSKETASQFDLDGYDYVLDCIDSLSDKAALILHASASKAVFFSSMGAALKMDPTKVRVAEFFDVRGCPLGAMLRKKLRREGTLPARKFLCVYDEEVLPNKGQGEKVDESMSFGKVRTNGTLVYITAIFGFTLSGLVVRDCLGGE